MSAKFDCEDVCAMLLHVMTNGGALNAKITAIEAEKAAKGLTLVPVLSSVASDAYYEQTWTDKLLNSNPAIFYGIEDVQTVDGGGAAAKTYKCFVEVILVDPGQTNDFAKRINRYSRALEELFISALGAAPEVGTIKIDTVRPIAFKVQVDSSEEIKVGGISISITLV